MKLYACVKLPDGTCGQVQMLVHSAGVPGALVQSFNGFYPAPVGRRAGSGARSQPPLVASRWYPLSALEVVP